MSHQIESSDSDDFYDACQDLESPKHAISSLLVAEDDDNSQNELTKDSTIHSNSEGTLSLDHLLTPDIEHVALDFVEEQSQSQTTSKEVEKNGAAEMVTRAEPAVAASEETEVFPEQTSDNADFCPLSPNELQSDSIPDVNSEVVVLPTDVEVQAVSIKSEKVLPCTAITETEDVATIVGEKAKPEEANQTLPLQKPDLVASIKERPFDLPGVQSFKLQAEVDVEPVQNLQPRIHHSSPARPKRPPPPRPKAPPKRPPPPKGSAAPKLKHYLNSADDGLLTPNSTVDNITREFAAALGDVATNSEERTSQPKSVEHKPSSTSPLAASSQQNKTLPSAELPHSSQSKETQNRQRSLGRRLSGSSSSQLDEEILSTVIVRNLDTGQTMPLSVAAEQVSQCLNPLALQIMSRTKEFACATVNPEEKALPVHNQPLVPEFPKVPSVDEDTISVESDDITIGGEAVGGKGFGEGGKKLRMKSKRFKQFIGKGARRVKEVAGSQVGKAVHKVKHSKIDNVHSEALNVSSDEEISDSMASSFVKTKASSSNKDSHLLTSRLKQVQDIAVHVGAVWSMKFSHCGRLLATAGQNNVIWVWVLKDYYAYFNDLRNKYDSKERGMVFVTPPRNSMEPLRDEEGPRTSRVGSDAGGTVYSGSDEPDDEEDAPFRSLPFSSYVGHSADVLDLAWSKNYFTLSSSMDKTVRLWHVSQKECLCCFQHIDFVTAIAFHPRDDRYFLSGSLDSKLRLWNIPEKKVALWNEVPPDSQASSSSAGGGALITTVNFCENGKFAVCGTYDGRCLFYDTEHLKYHTQIHVRSSRRRNHKGHKITGIEPLASEHKILVTSNDSRVRLYDLRDLSLTCKFKGLTNLSSQIKASFSHDYKYIICGSEDKAVYIWKTNPPQDVTKLSSFRRDRNDSWESIRAHNAVVTCAIFAPHPHLMVRNSERSDIGSRTSLRSFSKKSSSSSNLFIITADFSGVIKIFTTS